MTFVKLAGGAVGAILLGAFSVDADALRIARAPFDATRVALAIGLFEPHGGSAVLISRSGVAVTAYHVVAPCVARLRRQAGTREHFNADGSYDGKHGPLLCDGLALRIPTDCTTMGPPNDVYVLGVPPVKDAHVFRLAFDAEGMDTPRADVAVVTIGRPVDHYLPLSKTEPAQNAAIWVVGHPMPGNADPRLDASGRQQLELARLLFRTRQVVFGLLAEAATDPDEASRSAKRYAGLNARTPGAAPDLTTIWTGTDLNDIETIAQGPVPAVRVLAERLNQLAAELHTEAAARDTDPDYAAFLDARAGELRAMAEEPRGRRVRQVMLQMQRVYEAAARDVSSDLEATDVPASERWCEALAFSGHMTAVHESTFDGSTGIAPGMSGGAVMDERGAVVGVVTAGRRRTTRHLSDNLVAARSDVIRARFGKILSSTAGSADAARTLAGETTRAP